MDLGLEDGPLHGLLHVEQDLGDSEESHDHRDQPHPVGEFQDVEGEAVEAVMLSMPMQPRKRPKAAMSSAFHMGPLARKVSTVKPHDHQGKIFRGAELQGHGGQRGGDEHQAPRWRGSRR